MKRMHLWPVLLGLLLVGASSLLVVYAVPLYQLFCQVTGFGGTTQRAASDAAPVRVLDRVIRVRFDATVDPNLPWRFRPLVPHMDVRIGERATVAFVAENLADEPITGRAVFNVTPFKAGPYFVKTQCFCFTEQTLKPHQRVEMPVLFYVDPDLADDRDLDEVTEITLSYTFFKAPDQPNTAKDGLAKAGAPSVRNGQAATAAALAKTP